MPLGGIGLGELIVLLIMGSSCVVPMALVVWLVTRESKPRVVVHRRCTVCGTQYPEGRPCPKCGTL